jgi:putative FmdB family regulatory protein
MRLSDASRVAQACRKGGSGHVPIYTYECQSCGSSLERRQGFNDEPLKVHDDCGGGLRRVIYPAGIVFKGSGFYNTDYKNGTASNKPKESTDSKADGAKAESTTTDSSSGTSASTKSSTSGGESSRSKSGSGTESKSAAPAASTP